LSSVVFPSLPTDLRTLSYSKYHDTPQLQDRYSIPLSISTETLLINSIPPPAIDSLTSYALLPSLPDALDFHHFFTPLLTAYIAAVTAPPPIWSATRTSACELCLRDWIPLTYHHLIPKSTHERVRKRGWHEEERLNSVAWLCRACHSFVHRLAGNEELARRFYTIELISEGGVDGELMGILGRDGDGLTGLQGIPRRWRLWRGGSSGCEFCELRWYWLWLIVEQGWREVEEPVRNGKM
jgi:5-methylcytosine-specific restriction endonuclease McrA